MGSRADSELDGSPDSIETSDGILKGLPRGGTPRVITSASRGTAVSIADGTFPVAEMDNQDTK